VRVLGTTLWHHCPEKDIWQVERTLNDYAMIGVPSTTRTLSFPLLLRDTHHRTRMCGI
jgi:hypothetical protein